MSYFRVALLVFGVILCGCTTGTDALGPIANEQVTAPASGSLQSGQRQVSRTWLINGLASSVEIIGSGFEGLGRKIPGSKSYSYSSLVESATIIRSQVTRDIKQTHRKNPNVRINLIGFSYGANLMTWIVRELAKDNIEVNYLATLEGPVLLSIPDNVRVADNFSCTGLNCFRMNLKLAAGNSRTQLLNRKIRSSHVAMGGDETVHRIILKQISR